MGGKKSCKHEWELSYIRYEFPVGFSGTGNAEEYAYYCCMKCLEIVKKKVITKDNIKN